MSGYSKLFSTMWGGSLYGRFEASAVFMVVLSLCDHNGVLDMTPEAIAGTTGWPIDFLIKGLDELSAPDTRSRTPTEEGRRILKLDEHRDWGWRVTNYAWYRDQMRSVERREYLTNKKREQRLRDKLNGVNNGQQQSNSQPSQPITDTDTDTDTEADTDLRGTNVPVGEKTSRNCPYERIVELYHEILPTLPRVARLSTARKAQIQGRWNCKNQDLEGWADLFRYIGRSDFLMGRCTPRPGSDRPFKADLEWITKEANWLKIVEGKYDNAK